MSTPRFQKHAEGSFKDMGPTKGSLQWFQKKQQKWNKSPRKRIRALDDVTSFNTPARFTAGSSTETPFFTPQENASAFKTPSRVNPKTPGCSFATSDIEDFKTPRVDLSAAKTALASLSKMLKSAPLSTQKASDASPKMKIFSPGAAEGQEDSAAKPDVFLVKSNLFPISPSGSTRRPSQLSFSTTETRSEEESSISHRDRLIQFYRRYNPTKLDSVDSTLATYRGQEDVLFRKLEEKYVTGKEGMLPPSGNGPSCFLDFQSDDFRGRVVVKLYQDKAPLACENFRCLCTGEKGMGRSGMALCYRGSKVHRVVPNFCIQAGDITRSDGTGGESIYPPGKEFTDMWGKFKDETPFLMHSFKGLLSMANNGSNRNGSQFFITLKAIPQLDGKHVVFGEVVEGMDVVERIGRLETDGRQRPKETVVINDCGEVGSDGKEIKMEPSSGEAASPFGFGQSPLGDSGLCGFGMTLSSVYGGSKLPSGLSPGSARLNGETSSSVVSTSSTAGNTFGKAVTLDSEDTRDASDSASALVTKATSQKSALETNPFVIASSTSAVSKPFTSLTFPRTRDSSSTPFSFSATGQKVGIDSGKTVFASFEPTTEKHTTAASNRKEGDTRKKHTTAASGRTEGDTTEKHTTAASSRKEGGSIGCSSNLSTAFSTLPFGNGITSEKGSKQSVGKSLFGSTALSKESVPSKEPSFPLFASATASSTSPGNEPSTTTPLTSSVSTEVDAAEFVSPKSGFGADTQDPFPFRQQSHRSDENLSLKESPNIMSKRESDKPQAFTLFSLGQDRDLRSTTKSKKPFDTSSSEDGSYISQPVTQFSVGQAEDLRSATEPVKILGTSPSAQNENALDGPGKSFPIGLLPASNECAKVNREAKAAAGIAKSTIPSFYFGQQPKRLGATSSEDLTSNQIASCKQVSNASTEPRNDPFSVPAGETFTRAGTSALFSSLTPSFSTSETEARDRFASGISRTPLDSRGALCVSKETYPSARKSAMVFDSFDQRKEGEVDVTMFEDMLDELGESFHGEKMNKQISLIDPHGSGRIKRASFIKWYVQLVIDDADVKGNDVVSLGSDEKRKRDEGSEKARKAFMALSKRENGSDFIELPDFVRVFEGLGTVYCEEEHGTKVRELQSEDGRIHYSDFIGWYLDWLFGDDEGYEHVDDDDECERNRTLPSTAEGWGASFDVTQNMWQCHTCMARNKNPAKVCSACETLRRVYEAEDRKEISKIGGAFDLATTASGFVSDGTASATSQAFSFGFAEQNSNTPPRPVSGFTFRARGANVEGELRTKGTEFIHSSRSPSGLVFGGLSSPGRDQQAKPVVFGFGFASTDNAPPTQFDNATYTSTQVANPNLPISSTIISATDGGAPELQNKGTSLAATASKLSASPKAQAANCSEDVDSTTPMKPRCVISKSEVIEIEVDRKTAEKQENLKNRAAGNYQMKKHSKDIAEAVSDILAERLFTDDSLLDNVCVERVEKVMAQSVEKMIEILECIDDIESRGLAFSWNDVENVIKPSSVDQLSCDSSGEDFKSCCSSEDEE